jgi:hypothetical protein
VLVVASQSFFTKHISVPALRRKERGKPVADTGTMYIIIYIVYVCGGTTHQQIKQSKNKPSNNKNISENESEISLSANCALPIAFSSHDRPIFHGNNFHSEIASPELGSKSFRSCHGRYVFGKASQKQKKSNNKQTSLWWTHNIMSSSSLLNFKQKGSFLFTSNSSACLHFLLYTCLFCFPSSIACFKSKFNYIFNQPVTHT